MYIFCKVHGLPFIQGIFNEDKDFEKEVTDACSDAFRNFMKDSRVQSHLDPSKKW